VNNSELNRGLRTRQKPRKPHKTSRACRLFNMLRRNVILQFRSSPYWLDQKEAEKCAKCFLREIR
jgi:hypothetical protein